MEIKKTKILCLRTDCKTNLFQYFLCYVILFIYLFSILFVKVNIVKIIHMLIVYEHTFAKHNIFPI